jgi:uncharacterized protein YcbK (DUF882 family)
MTSPDFNMADTTASARGGLTTSEDDGQPVQVASLAGVKPAEGSAAVAPATESAAGQTSKTDEAQPAGEAPPTVAASVPATNDGAVKAEESVPAAAPKAATAADKKDGSDAQDKNQVVVTATDPSASAPIEPKKRGFLAAFFGVSPAATSPDRSEPAAPAKAEKSQPAVQLAVASEEDTKPLAVRAALTGGELDDLPGVRQTALFEIKRKSGIDDDSDVDLHEDEVYGSVQLASAAGLARLAPNGLLTQSGHVDVACLKPALVRVLKIVESHYGRKALVTSGYRSPEHNRRARGAKNSLHMYCAAADVQVPGISKWELASFVRSMPGRGGVGTYCHTESVHVDVGPERDWNWRCRRRS